MLITPLLAAAEADPRPSESIPWNVARARQAVERAWLGSTPLHEESPSSASPEGILARTLMTSIDRAAGRVLA
jgi:hypothetical protein